jgi:CRISPR-associated protein Cmr5
MNKIERLLPPALDAAQKFITIDKERLSVPKQFKGYISSFGASVIQSGLMPTLAFYSDAGKGKGNRSLLVPALIDILFQNGSYPIDIEVQKALDVLDKDKDKDMKPIVYHFFDWLLKTNGKNPEKLRRELMDASIALKLALRTFREDDNDKKKKS